MTTGAKGAKRRQELVLLQEIAIKAHKAGSAREVLHFTLRATCRHGDWDVGHAFLLRRRPDLRLLPAPSLWTCADPRRFRGFRNLTRRSSFEIGQGLVGAVAKRRKPRWVENIADASPPIRFTDADIGIGSGLLVPVVLRSDPSAAAVLEFYSAARRREQPAQLRMAASIGALLGTIFEREQAERELAQSREIEQRRIGRELHDTVSQDLTGIAMMGERLAEQLDEAGSAAADRMRTLVDHVSRVRARVHALSRGLLPVEIEAGRLRQALDYLAANARQMHEIDCRVECDENVDVEDDVVANHLVRIAQEALQNAAKHARAGRVVMALAQRGSRTVLTVTDDGVGFSPQRQKVGVGLRLMRHRAADIGAELTVRSSRTRKGTQIRCEWQA